MTENLAHPQFSKGLSGYKVEEVDSYIDKVLDTVKDLRTRMRFWKKDRRTGRKSAEIPRG